MSYYLDPATDHHQVEIRAIMAGAANIWVVQIGKILDATMQGCDIRSAFDTVTKTSNLDGTSDVLLIFQLRNYQFANFQTTLELEITVRDQGREVLSASLSRKRYQPRWEDVLGWWLCHEKCRSAVHEGCDRQGSHTPHRRSANDV